MKKIYIPFVIFVSVLTLISNSLHAEEVCYPDQYPLDGCEGVATLEWGINTPQEEMAPSDNSPVSISGGKPPFTWSIEGNGFYFDEAGTSKTIITDSLNANIYTLDACGSGVVTVTDACGKEIEGAARSTVGVWSQVGEFTPVNLRETGPHPFINPIALGMFHIGQTVAYNTKIPGYGTRSSGQYILQEKYFSPQTYMDFTFYTGNSWGWGYYDESLVEAPEAFFMDPVVGKFKIRVFGGTQYRAANYYKYYCATRTLVVWEWKCN